MKKYKAYENQTWLDLSMHIYGDSTFAFQLAEINNHSITDDLKAGQIVDYLPVSDLKKYVILSLALNGSIPATSLNEIIKNIPEDNFGIGEMAIELTFIVR